MTFPPTTTTTKLFNSLFISNYVWDLTVKNSCQMGVRSQVGDVNLHCLLGFSCMIHIKYSRGYQHFWLARHQSCCDQADELTRWDGFAIVTKAYMNDV